jgi:uncharacterized repeat protein (TIGR01451 family)
MKRTTRRFTPMMAIQVALAAGLATPSLAGGLPPQGDPAPPAIEIQKLTNGIDTDGAPGISIPVGQSLTWTYVLINTGGSTLYNLEIADSTGVDVSCAGTETLEPGEMMLCGATMTVQPGPFRSRGIVAAVTAEGAVVDDSDPAYHVGTVTKQSSMPPAIAVDLLVDGIDADSAPGPGLTTGSMVTWTFVVTNSGGATLTEVTVTDSLGNDVSCAGTESLEPGESMVCGAYGEVTPGPHRSLGIATGVAPDGNLVSASDPSYHVGI